MIAPNISWSQKFNIPDTYALYDVVTSVVTSKDGSIFILTKESLTKFSAAGSFMWQKSQGGTALFIDQNDYLYLASRYSGSTPASNGNIFKLNTDGVVIWQNPEIYAGYRNAALTPDGGIVALTTNASTNIRKFGISGELIWTANIGIHLAYDVAVGSDGTIYVCGTTPNNGYDGVIGAFDSMGNQLWIKTIGSSEYDSLNEVVVAPDGTIYVAGETQGNLDNLSTERWIRDGFIAKYSPTGQKLWSKLIGAADGSGVQSLTLGKNGSIYVTGSTGRSIDGQAFNSDGAKLTTDAYVVSFLPDGTRQWTKLLGTTLKEEGDAIFVSADGSIFVGGIVGTNIIGKVEPNTFQGFITKLGSESIATYSLKASSTTINEGSTTTFTLTTTNVSAGTLVPYILSGISAADVFGGSLSGTSVVNSSGVATISVPLLNDFLTEGSETLIITAGGATASTVVNDTSKSITTATPNLLSQSQMQTALAMTFNSYTPTVSGVTWNFWASYYGVNWLGKDVNVTTFNASTSSVYDIYALSIDDPDYLAIFDSNGSLIKTSSEATDWSAFSDSSGRSFDYDNILAWSPPKNGTYYIAVVLSQSTSQLDYWFGAYETRPSITVSYSLSASASSIDEGSTASFNLITTGVTSGSSISYTISGVSAADISGGTLSGTVIVDSNGYSKISVPILADNLTEGPETLTLSLQGKTAAILINDTSKSVATYSLSANSTSVNEGVAATFILTTSNVAAGTSISYTTSGISVADLASGSLTGISTVATNGQAIITINLANDNLTEGTETLTVLAQGQTASTLVNDTSKSNTSKFPTVLTQQQMQNAPALAFTAFTPTDPAVKWNFSSFFFGTNLLGKDFNLTSFYGSASSIYDFNALSIDDPDYLAIFDSNGNLIISSSEVKDLAAWVDSSGKSFDYDNISTWSPPKDGTYYLGVVLSQTSSTPFYSFGGYETRATVISIPFGNGKYFYGSSGPDNVIGTFYVDVLKQTSNSASNQLTKLADGSWQVQNKLTPSNSDNLANVERIEFSDMSVALDVSGPAGQVAKILGSVFGKSNVSNTVFAGIGLAYLDGGMSYLDLCGLAAGAAGLSTPDLLVATLLRNTTGTEPTALSKSSYLQSISSGSSYASVVQQIADSSANAQSIKLTDLANTGLAYTPHVLQPTYILSASSASVNEGTTAVFNLTTTNVAVGSEVSYTISGVSSADLTSGTLTGKVSIGVGGTASISVSIAADGLTEGQETMTISAQGVTASIVINDTSKSIASPTYTLTPATTSINEGVLAQVYVSTTNVAAGTSLLFSIGGIGITQGDVIEGLSRFVTVDSTGKAVIDINTIADQITEGPETMYITLGTATTSFIINDTSVILVGVIDSGGGDGGGGGGGGAGGD